MEHADRIDLIKFIFLITSIVDFLTCELAASDCAERGEPELPHSSCPWPEPAEKSHLVAHSGRPLDHNCVSVGVVPDQIMSQLLRGFLARVSMSWMHWTCF